MKTHKISLSKSADGRSHYQPDEGSRASQSPRGAPGGAGSDRPLASLGECPVRFSEKLNFVMGHYTNEFGKPQKHNFNCCLVTEGVRASPDLARVLCGRKINGKAICFTGSGLTITVDRWRAEYVITDENVLFDIVRFDDGSLTVDERHPRRAWAQFLRVVEITPNSPERTAQVNSARRTLKIERDAGRAPPAKKRDRLAVLRRELNKRGWAA